MKCVIFGGGGFIGSAIVDRLLLDRHHVRVFERPGVVPFREFSSNERVEWLTGDMLSKFDVGLALDEVDVVIHLVSTTLPKGSNDDPIYDVETNVIGSLHLLNAMVIQKIPKVIFISSGGTVYGKPIYLPVDELHPTNPEVPYGITKLTIEKYLLMFEKIHGVKSIILRVSNPYGERQRVETSQGAVGVFLNKAMRKEPIEIWGDGSVIRDFIYIGDVADAFAKALYYKGIKSIFNISSGVGTSLNELIVNVESIIECKVNCNYLPSRNFDVPVNILDNLLAKQELAWSPIVPLKDGLKRTIDWMKK